MAVAKKRQVVIYSHRLNHAHPWLEAVKAGFYRHGIHAETLNIGEWAECSLAVHWGVGNYVDSMRRQREAGARTLVVERGYVGDRFSETSMGFDGLNGHADFRFDNVRDGGARWRALYGLERPWQPEGYGDYILILGQTPGDQSVKGVDLERFYKSAMEYFGGDHIVRFRPHPNVEPSHEFTLEEDLAGASLAITYNSNSGVDAVLAGVPTITADPGSMAWDVTTHKFSDKPIRPDRHQWLSRLAYCQWSLAEIADGDAWAHLGTNLEW